MKYIKLTKNKTALVDDEDFEYLNQWKWHYTSNGYARRIEHISGSKKNRITKAIYMHNDIMKTPKGMDTDHINRDRLDNRRENLRIVTRTMNNINSKLFKTNTSGYRGVYWEKRKEKWMALIEISGKRFHLGYFSSPEEAAYVRDEAIKFNFGSKMYLNFL